MDTLLFFFKTDEHDLVTFTNEALKDAAEVTDHVKYLSIPGIAKVSDESLTDEFSGTSAGSSGICGRELFESFSLSLSGASFREGQLIDLVPDADVHNIKGSYVFGLWLADLEPLGMPLVVRRIIN